MRAGTRNRHKTLQTAVVWVVLAVAIAGWVAADDDGARKLTSVDRTVLAEGAAWGSITTLADGSLGVVYQKARPVEECQGVNVAMQWIRSTDGGKSWSPPVLISERRGPKGKLYQKRPKGGYVVFQDRNQALGQLPRGRIVVSFTRLNYHYREDGAPENRPGKNFPHDNQGAFFSWSDDLGKTWSKVRALNTGPVGGKGGSVNPHGPIVTLADGTAMMSLYGSYDPRYRGLIKVPEGTRKLSAVIRSTDNGRTWRDPSVILADPSDQYYEETALCLVGRKLLAHVRTPSGKVVQYFSADDGRTWQGSAPLTEDGQQPGGAMVLASGKLLATWGNRRPPYGAAAMLSRDDGENWDYSHRVSLAWDAPNGNSGYANGAQAGDGTIVVVYYAMPSESNYHNLWMGSKVYAVRFTEEQFLEAAAQ